MSSTPNIKPPNGEISPQTALDWFKSTELSSYPPYFLTHWKTKKSFFLFNETLLAFEKTKGQLIISGEPAKSQQINEKEVYKAFIKFAHEKKKKVCGFYVGENWQVEPFKKRPIGTSFRLHLDSYDFKSSKAKEVRRSLRKGDEKEYKVISSDKIDIVKLQKLLRLWKKKKLPIKLKFFLSEPRLNSLTADFEKWHVIEKNGDYYAFCSTLPYKNKDRRGLYIDHLVYDPLNEKFALSYLVSQLIQRSKKNQIDEINLGLNPFANIQSKGLTESLFKYLYNMPFLYRPKGLHYFKSKFAGQEEPEFFFHENNNSPLLSLAGMLKTTFKRSSQKN